MAASPARPGAISALSEDQLRGLEEAFEMFDTKHEGKIPVDSVNAVLEALGFPANEQRIKAMIQRLYISQASDGLITKEHFLNGMAYLAQALTRAPVQDDSLIATPTSPSPASSPIRPASSPAYRADTADLQRQLNELKLRNETLAGQLDFHKRQVKEAENINRRITEDFAKTTEELNDIKKHTKSDGSREKVRRLVEETEQLKGELEELKASEEAAKKTTAKLTQERNHLNGMVATYSEQLTALSLEKNTLMNRLSQTHSFAAEKKQLSDELAFIQSKMDALQQEKATLAALVQSLKNQNLALEKRVTAAELALRDAQDELRRAPQAMGSVLGTSIQEELAGAMNSASFQGLEELNTGLKRDLELLRSKLQLMEDECGLLRAESSNKLSLEQEREMKEALSQEQGRRLTLENTLKSKEDEITNARAEVARLLQELQRLKEVESDHTECGKRMKDLNSRFGQLDDELKNLRQESSMLREELRKANDMLNESDSGREVQSSDRQSLTANNPVFERICCFWCPVDDPPRPNSRRAQILRDVASNEDS